MPAARAPWERFRSRSNGHRHGSRPAGNDFRGSRLTDFSAIVRELCALGQGVARWGVSPQQFAELERLLGSYGGQMYSFDWVFSPRGKDGRPEPMFNHDTGAVDPDVVAYWRDHYDITHRSQQNWPMLKPDLDGKIHLIVGTTDTFYLDGAVHKLKAVLDGLHAGSDFRFVPNRTHGRSVYDRQ